MTGTGQIGLSSKIVTTLTGGGRSVIGNVTISFCAAVIAGVALAIAFLAAGAPPMLALAAFVVAAAFFMVFLFVTLRHAAAHPDAAVTSEEHYARVIEVRMGAKDPQLVKSQTPVLGGASEVIAALSASNEEPDA